MSLKRPLRQAFRLLRLGAELSFCALAYLPKVAASSVADKRLARARWLQFTCRRMARVFNIDIRAQGPLSTRGLLVSNHLSYLDIVVLGSFTPTVFISKSEVAKWPVFGWFARMSGSIFVQREKRTDVARATEQIREVLRSDVVVVLFPEGTSSGGATVLPFKSSLLEPAIGLDGLAVAHLEYSLSDGNASDEVCYWGDMTLAPHLINLLGKQSITARAHFARTNAPEADRKELARHLHTVVMELRCSHPQT